MAYRQTHLGGEHDRVYYQYRNRVWRLLPQYQCVQYYQA